MQANSISSQVMSRLRPKDIYQDILRCSRSKFYKMIADGEWTPPLKDGRMAFWTAEEVESLVNARTATAEKVRGLK